MQELHFFPGLQLASSSREREIQSHRERENETRQRETENRRVESQLVDGESVIEAEVRIQGEREEKRKKIVICVR